MFRFLKNAHMVNYILVSAALVAPVVIFTMRNKPDSTEVEAVLNESYADKVQKVKQNTEKINSFWKVKRNSKEMDEIYSQLLRSGKGSVSRHYELTGALAEAESKNNPQYAHVQAILAVPDGQTPATKEAAASAGGAAPASGAVPVAAVPAGSKAAAAGAAAGKQAGQSQAAAVPAAQGATAVGAAPVAAVDAQPAQPVAWYWRVLGY